MSEKELKDTTALAVNVGLAAITARITDMEEVHQLDMEMAARRAAGETLSEEEIEAHFAKAEQALNELQAQIDAARARLVR